MSVSDELLSAIARAIAHTLEGEMRVVRAEIAMSRAELTAELASAKAELAGDRLAYRDLIDRARERPPTAKLLKAG
jgi:hypothetical protein